MIDYNELESTCDDEAAIWSPLSFAELADTLQAALRYTELRRTAAQARASGDTAIALVFEQRADSGLACLRSNDYASASLYFNGE